MTGYHSNVIQEAHNLFQRMYVSGISTNSFRRQDAMNSAIIAAEYLSDTLPSSAGNDPFHPDVTRNNSEFWIDVMEHLQEMDV